VVWNHVDHLWCRRSHAYGNNYDNVLLEVGRGRDKRVNYYWHARACRVNILS